MKKWKQNGVINTLIGKFYEICGKKMTNSEKKDTRQELMIS
jgi:hypothetical protein